MNRQRDIRLLSIVIQPQIGLCVTENGEKTPWLLAWDKGLLGE